MLVRILTMHLLNICLLYGQQVIFFRVCVCVCVCMCVCTRACAGLQRAGGPSYSHPDAPGVLLGFELHPHRNARHGNPWQCRHTAGGQFSSWPHNKHSTWLAVDRSQLKPLWCLHDSQGAKILNYAKWKTSANAMFVVFTLIFALTRMVILPFWWVWGCYHSHNRQSSLICALFFPSRLEMYIILSKHFST